MKHAAVSWIKSRPWIALGMLALVARVGCAVVTEFRPLFPAYYYTDAVIIRDDAIRALDDLESRRVPRISGSLSVRLQTFFTMTAYRVFGRHELVVKLLNAALGAGGVVMFAWAMSLIFPEDAALTTGLLVALWPSHIFYTSQNFKESPTALLAFSGLAAVLTLGLRCPRKGPEAASLFVAAVFSLLGAGFYRSYVLLSLFISLFLAFCLQAVIQKGRRPAFAAIAAVATAAALHPWASTRLFSAFQSYSPPQELSVKREAALESTPMLPVALEREDSGSVYRPTSPEGITNFRRARQSSDRVWAQREEGREIGTQIFPDAAFKTWGDVAAYLPKGAFYVLFMPLPGLYPMDGKLGRYAAGGENILLLAIFTLAAFNFMRGPKTPARFGLLGFFAVMTIGSALLEFDLGSAGRHKLLYLPMLFPFAAEEAIRLWGLKESA